MQLIVLAGLLSLEKITVALELIPALPAAPITILDGLSRIEFPVEQLPPHVQYQNVVEDLAQQTRLIQAVAVLNTPTALWLTPESLHPNALFTVIDQIESTNPAQQTQIISMADDRTCDCFPHLAQLLDDNADLALRPPFLIEDILAIL